MNNKGGILTFTNGLAQIQLNHEEQAQELVTIQSQNPCDHCETLYMYGETEIINEAEIIYEYVCFGNRCHMQLCHEHYLERKAMDYEK